MLRRFLGLVPARTFRPQPLQLPLTLPPTARIAQVSIGPEFASARIFRRTEWCDLPAFEPDVLVGYGLDLERLATAIDRGTIAPVAVQRLAFTLVDCGTRVANNTLREHLWHTFRVPLFECIVTTGCHLLAAECEAHRGWHLQPGFDVSLQAGELVCHTPLKSSFETGFAGALETLPCPCGRPTPRLLQLQPHARSRRLAPEEMTIEQASGAVETLRSQAEACATEARGWRRAPGKNATLP